MIEPPLLMRDADTNINRRKSLLEVVVVVVVVGCGGGGGERRWGCVCGGLRWG